MTSDTAGRRNTVYCRLCEGKCAKQFEALVLKRYKVSYYKCENCGSLQTEEPFWLNEAYTDPVSHFDSDYLDRGIRVAELVLAMWRILGLPVNVPILDFGAGIGISTQRLRDYGLNSFALDKHTKNIFNPRLEWLGENHPRIIIAAEVFEHLPNPRNDLLDIFSLSADFIIATTYLYNNQKEDWAYIGLDHGQHVFFYTAKAMQIVAGRFGYKILLLGNVMLFYRRPISLVRRLLLLIILRTKTRPVRAVYAIWRSTR